MVLPSTEQLFGDADGPLEVANQFEAYKSELRKSHQNPIGAMGIPTLSGPTNPLADLQKALGSSEVSKAISPELLESVRTSLANSDVMKDIYAGTNSGVGGASQLAGTGGLQAYDLEAPAKLLAPRQTPLRNRIARRKGIGLAHQWKTITGFTGTGTGGVGLLRPGITESTTNSFGSVSQMRGPKISYAGTQSSTPYIQFSVSDMVSFGAQFSGQGYQDIRQLSQTTLLYSSMLLEDRLLLGGRGTASGFQGALAAPTSVAVAGATPATGTVGVTGVTTNVYVLVTAECVFGESILSSVANGAVTNTTQNAVVTATLPQGATGMRVYVGTGASAPGSNASYFFAGRSSNGSFTIQGALPTTGVAASSVTADNSATATEYDGILTVCAGSNSGYVKTLNNSFAGADGANVGNTFSNAFAALYDSVKADPDEILANGHDRKQVSDQLKNESSASYRITVDSASQAHNAQIGALVVGVQNEVTGKMVDLTVNPWLPQGNMPIISWTLPLPDSNISDVWSVFNVQDYMAIDWPVTQLAYESSSYWYGTFVCYAPAWNGMINGITQA